MSRWSKISDALFTDEHLFVTGFDVPGDWRLPDEFKPTAYAGMCLLQRTRNSFGKDLVLIWWADPRYYKDIWSGELATELSLPWKPMFSGTATEHTPAAKPFWSQPKKWGPWLVAAAATSVTLLGNFTQLENYGAWLLATPRIDIAVNKLPPRLIQNEIGAAEFKLHSRSAGTCRITALTAKPSSAKAITMDSTVGPLPALEPGELRSVALPLLPLLPGVQEITLQGEAKAGRWRRHTSLTPTILKVDIWEPLQRSPHIRFQNSHGDAAIYGLTVRHGKPPTKILAYQATGPDFLTFAALDGAKFNFKSNPGQGAAVIKWEKEATPLQSQDFTLTVRGNKSYSEQEWKQYESAITIDVAPAAEK